jgi:hypothetical protein
MSIYMKYYYYYHHHYRCRRRRRHHHHIHHPHKHHHLCISVNDRDTILCSVIRYNYYFISTRHQLCVCKGL